MPPRQPPQHLEIRYNDSGDNVQQPEWNTTPAPFGLAGTPKEQLAQALESYGYSRTEETIRQEFLFAFPLPTGNKPSNIVGQQLWGNSDKLPMSLHRN